MQQSTTVNYALRLKTTGELITCDNDTRSGHFELKYGPGGQHTDVYLRDNPEQLTRLLQGKGRRYSYDANYPDMNGITTQNVDVVKITVTTLVETVQVELPPTLVSVHSARKPMLLMNRYAKDTLPDIANNLSIFVMPLGESLESMKRFENKEIYTADESSLYLYRVFALPETYDFYLNGELGFAAATADTYDAQTLTNKDT
ncbi:MAG: hypothetical protein Q7S87_01275 [Agitococcus sp.]|nr:hypothetical protein [Agitococcus sp.]MDO9179157.1 hypothetical protein [Agitococcus sp.]